LANARQHLEYSAGQNQKRILWIWLIACRIWRYDMPDAGGIYIMSQFWATRSCSMGLWRRRINLVLPDAIVL